MDKWEILLRNYRLSPNPQTERAVKNEIKSSRRGVLPARFKYLLETLKQNPEQATKYKNQAIFKKHERVAAKEISRIMKSDQRLKEIDQFTSQKAVERAVIARDTPKPPSKMKPISLAILGLGAAAGGAGIYFANKGKKRDE